MTTELKDDKGEASKTGHVYDGIEELDHPPPGWFNGLFLGTIAVGLVYFVYYSIGEGPTLLQEYERDKAAEEYVRSARDAKEGSKNLLSEEELRAIAKDPARVALGARAFKSKCVSCHGSQGQGGIGPNLTDAHWLHGGEMTQVLATVSRGVPEKGMPPWGQLLLPEELSAVTGYIRSISGTNPAGAKEPQGVEVKQK